MQNQDYQNKYFKDFKLTAFESDINDELRNLDAKLVEEKQFPEKFTIMYEKIVDLFKKVDPTEAKRDYKAEAIMWSGGLLLTLNNYFHKLTQCTNIQQILSVN